MNIQKNFINPPLRGEQPRHLSIKFYIKKNMAVPGQAAKPIVLKRPLIQLSRFECFKFCEFWTLPIFPDITNFNFNSCRNRLRLQLIPYLKYFFNLNLNQRIKIFQELINIENQYFKSLLRKRDIPQRREYFPKIFKYQIFHTFLQNCREVEGPLA